MSTIEQVADSLDTQLGEIAGTDPLAALATVASVRAVVARQERAAVLAALALHTWREVGEALGVSKQAAFQRFGKDCVVASKAQLSKPEWKQAVKRSLSS